MFPSPDGSNHRRAVKRWALVLIAVRVLPHRFLAYTLLLDHDRQLPTTKGRGRVVPASDMAIAGLNAVKKATGTTPVNPVFGSVAVLTMIRASPLPFRDEVFNEADI